MGTEEEAAVRSFLAEFEAETSDSALIERVLGRMAADARYQVFAWEDALVGHDSIRAELLRQVPNHRDFRVEVLTIGSVGHTVFIERLDSMTINHKPVTFHVAGVFEVNVDGQIAAWRDYLDSREVTTKVGTDVSSAGTRT